MQRVYRLFIEKNELEKYRLKNAKAFAAKDFRRYCLRFNTHKGCRTI